MEECLARSHSLNRNKPVGTGFRPDTHNPGVFARKPGASEIRTKWGRVNRAAGFSNLKNDCGQGVLEGFLRIVSTGQRQKDSGGTATNHEEGYDGNKEPHKVRFANCHAHESA